MKGGVAIFNWEQYRQQRVWGKRPHVMGTAGLKVKDYFEICIPPPLSPLSPTRPPPRSHHFHTPKIKSCLHRRGDE